MTRRILPPSDKYASCPYDEKVLSYYEGQFEAVYVVLSPFIRPRSISLDRFNPESWPSKQDLVAGSEPVTWKQILSMVSLKSIAEIDIGLRSSISGLNKKYANEDFAECLHLIAESEQLILPSEGDISPLVENRMYEALKRIGEQWLWVGDEFCTERKLFWIDDLIDGDEIPAHGCVFTPDKSILVTTHWDSHFSFLCSSKSKIERILEHEPFEGFYCAEETEVFWSVWNK